MITEIRATITNKLKNIKPTDLLFGGLYHVGRLTMHYKTFCAAGFCGLSGDRQRYPHLNISTHLNYDPKLDMLKFSDEADLRRVSNDILRKELFFYELFSPSAKRLNLKDCIGFKVTGSEKVKAFVSILKLYIENSIRWRLGHDMFGGQLEIRDLDLGALGLEKGFEALSGHLDRSAGVKAKLVIIKTDGPPLHMGVVLKGTNLSFADGSEAVQRGEIFHSIWHAEEGIAGFKGDNRYIIETWATALWLYVYQAFKGRAERRIRKNSSPHDVKFRDYISLRAYVGRGLVSEAIRGEKDDRGYFHGLYGILTPGLKLINSLLPEGERNDIFIKALFEGSAPRIIKAIDDRLGDGAYREIFHNWDTIFKRLDLVRARAEKAGIEFKDIFRMMFSNEVMLPTLLDNRLAALVWLSKEINGRADLVLDLIEDHHSAALKAPEDGKITIERWQEILRAAGKAADAEMIGREKNLYSDVLMALNTTGPAHGQASKIIEVESKFLIPRARISEIAAVPEIGGFTAGPIIAESQKNTYYDSPNLSILKGKGTLRVREVAGKFEATLKVPSPEAVVEGSLSRSEHNEEISSIDALPESGVFSAATRMYGAESFSVIFTTKTDRKTIPFENGASKIEVALDAITYIDTNGAVFFEEHEIEAENKTASQDEYAAFVRALQQKFDLSGSPSPKYVRGVLALAKITS